MKNNKLKPTITDWLITIFESPATFLLCLLWVIQVLRITKRTKMESESILECFVRTIKEWQHVINYSIFRWKMFVTLVFYSSLILFILFL